MVVEKIRIASRQSDLARLQAWAVGTALKRQFKNLEIEYTFRTSLGDQNANDPLWKMPEKGVFTEDFVDDLRSGRVDLVVHSWKDLPIGERSGTRIVGTLQRADVRDVLLIRKDRWEQQGSEKSLRILTSSPRREHNLKTNLQWILPLGNSSGRSEGSIEFVPVRGNILTRVRKLFGYKDAGDGADGLIVAKAALDRLLSFQSNHFHDVPEAIIKSKELEAGAAELRDWISKTHFVVLPLRVNPTAAAQGALAIEARTDNHEVIEMVAAISDNATFRDVENEREILASYGGGCHQKIGVSVLSRDYGRIRCLQGRTDQGIDLNSVQFLDQELKTHGASVSSAEMFFDVRREPLRWQEPSDENLEKRQRIGYFVSKSDAWPLAQVRPDPIVWVSGLETWKSLTAKGVWVHGSSESLGEQEDRRIEDLLLNQSVHWITLTHDSAHRSESGSSALAPRVGTYKINRKMKTLSECLSLIRASEDSVFWKSASDVRDFFELLKREGTDEQRRYVTTKVSHLSGPGWTHQALKEFASLQGPLVHLNVIVS